MGSRRFFVVVMMILCMIYTTVVASGEELTKAVAVDKVLNIYENPQKDSKVVSSLGIGDEISILGNEGKWLKISTENGIHGWVYSQSVLIADNNNNPIKEGVVNGEYLCVYELPDLNSAPKGALGFTSKVSIIAQEGEWFRVAIGGEIIGWVPAQYITVTTTQLFPKAMVMKDKTKIKAEPTYNSDTIVEVEKNTTVLLKDYGTDFFHVILGDGQEGWIHKYQIKTVHEMIDENGGSYFSKYTAPQIDKSDIASETFENIKKVSTLIGKDFTATAYDLSVSSCGKEVGEKYRGFTSTGIDLNGKQWGDVMVASVDSKVISLGSRILIIFEPDDWRSKYNGIYMAGDTGGGVNGKTIDIFMGDNGNDRLEEAEEFGRGKNVEIYLID
jgi:3D (Asp-Asp-Asp) domain-containing protein/uncharacterized protein YgiM (DUF1202 family)